MDITANSVSIQNAGRGEIAPAGVGVPACTVFRLAQRPVLDLYASVGSMPSSLRTSSKAAAMALSMS